MIERKKYLERIEPFIDKDIIKVLVGMRRCGKSTLLESIREMIINRGIPRENTLIMNFESMKWEDTATSARSFYNTVISFTKNMTGRSYLFFDEIQTVMDWEKAINSLRVDIDCDIYITGSNSKMLSGELATLLGGRYVSFEIYSFSLLEVMDALKINDPQYAYELYRVLGGLPFLSSINYVQESSISYLRDVFNSIVLKDVIQRHNFRKTDQLERIISYFISEVGTTYSVENIVKTLQEDKRSISIDSVYNYLQAASNAMLLSRVKRYDVKGKALLRGGEKVYITDLGLREAMFGNNANRLDIVLENIVFVELRRRGYEVYVGKVGVKEIDFIAVKNGKKIYLQVAYLLESASTREREFSALEDVPDNYPKYVVSTDKTDWSCDGIQCLNIIDFLISDMWEIV